MILRLYEESVLNGTEILRYNRDRSGIMVKPKALGRAVNVRVGVGSDKDPFPRGDGEHLRVQGRKGNE